MRRGRPDDFSVFFEQADAAGESFAAPSQMNPSSGLALDAQLDAGSLAAGARPGGGSGVVKSYTSGSAAVDDDANEFNIQINFSGRWTTEQQAVVKWAADFFSQLITNDVRDDTDLSSNPVDDIVITISTGRIDGKGNPITGGNTLAQTGVTAANLTLTDHPIVVVVEAGGQTCR